MSNDDCVNATQMFDTAKAERYAAERTHHDAVSAVDEARRDLITVQGVHAAALQGVGIAAQMVSSAENAVRYQEPGADSQLAAAQDQKRRADGDEAAAKYEVDRVEGRLYSAEQAERAAASDLSSAQSRETHWEREKREKCKD